ncbi:MAG: hypothetical protein Q7J84_06785, partial [Sulfuricaulis sp.]|nr:hypothetical protein [Sulfuricaulis sp.]
TAPTEAGSVPDDLRLQLLDGRAAVESVLGQFTAAREHFATALEQCEMLIGSDLGEPAWKLSLASRLPDLCRGLARVNEYLRVRALIS